MLRALRLPPGCFPAAPGRLPLRCRRAVGIAAACAALAAGPGCNLDITRIRTNVPLNQEAFQRLEVDRTTRGEALEALGAPDKLEPKPDHEYLWWLHQDSSRVGIRLESPVSLFGYQHTIAELDVNAEDVNAIRLVFDQQGILRQKSLRLSPAFARPVGRAGPGWSLYLLPRYSVVPLTFGDGGEGDYSELFSWGQVFGGYVGFLPAPYFMILVGGNYQVYQGESFNTALGRAHLEDLQLYQLEIGGRFQLPPEFFANMFDITRLREIFYTDDVSLHRGFFVYFQWTLGGTWNEEVGVRIQGAPTSSYYDSSFGLSNNLGLGVEYRWARLGAHVGAEYQQLTPFDEGNSPLEDDADGMNNVVITGGLTFRF